MAKRGGSMPKQTLGDMKIIAESRGGFCLSDKYINSETHLLWKCASGHEWEAMPGLVKQGTWCPDCSRCPRVTLLQLQELALKKGGICLSSVYFNAKTKMLWQCASGHEWEAVSDSIKHGTWCPECAGVKRKTIKDMHNLAKEKGGEFISDSYTNVNKNHKWRCADGHEWEAQPAHIRNGTWCPLCSAAKRGAGRKLTIEFMHELAKEQNGKCLSTQYVDAKSKLKWRCDDGHEWESAPDGIKSRGKWCPECAGVAALTIEKLHSLAKERGGHCLSKESKNNKDRYNWRCDQGHEWDAAYLSVYSGGWCPECSSGRGERLVRNVLSSIFCAQFLKTRPLWLRGDAGWPLELDGYCENLSIAFEYQGRQHYEVMWYSNKETAESQKRRDSMKQKTCHSRGVYLIIVPQFRNFKNLSGCLDQIEASVLFSGLKIPRKWKRPVDLRIFDCVKPLTLNAS